MGLSCRFPKPILVAGAHHLPNKSLLQQCPSQFQQSDRGLIPSVPLVITQSGAAGLAEVLFRTAYVLEKSIRFCGLVAVLLGPRLRNDESCAAERSPPGALAVAAASNRRVTACPVLNMGSYTCYTWYLHV